MSVRPLEGRRFYFVGLGGAGLSAYANFARAWGAQVAGWDVRETIFLESLDGVAVDIGREPAPPAGFEVVVSTAHAGRVEGRSRADSSPSSSRCAERSSSAAPTVRQPRPPWSRTSCASSARIRRGSSAASSRSSAGTRARGRGGSSSRATSRSIDRAARARDRRRDERRARPPRDVRLRGRARHVLRGWLSQAPTAVRGWELAPVELALSVPGEHNRVNAATALAVLEAAGIRSRGRRAGDRRLRRRRATLRARRRARWRAVVDDYAHNPTEIAAALATARALEPHAVSPSTSPHVYERTRQLHHRARRGVGAADAADRDRRHRRPRRADRGRRGKLVLDRVPPPTRRGWAPTLEDAAAIGARVGSSR